MKIRFLVIALLILSLTGGAAYAASVTLAWDPVSEATGYRLYYGTSTGSHPESIDAGDVIQYEVAGLEEGVTYYFVVRAYDSTRESADSNEVSYSVPLSTASDTTSDSTSSDDTTSDSTTSDGTTSDSTTTDSTSTDTTGSTDTADSDSAASDTTASDTTVPDTTLPTVAITSPTADSYYETDKSNLDLGGTASDDVGVTLVSWVNSRGGSGDASGTASWAIAGISLSKGKNEVTVSAVDAAGNSASSIMTIKRGKAPKAPKGLKTK